MCDRVCLEVFLMKFQRLYLWVYVAALFVREWLVLPNATTLQTTFHWLSGLFPLRHWHLSTIAASQHFQLSHYWLTLLNICQHVRFLWDGIRPLWSKHAGNSITVDRQERSLLTASKRASWPANEKPCVSTLHLANAWLGPGGGIPMIIWAKELTSENRTTV